MLNQIPTQINCSIYKSKSKIESVVAGHSLSLLYLRERLLQPAASRADDLPQCTKHLSQEILHRKHQHKQLIVFSALQLNTHITESPKHEQRIETCNRNGSY